MFTGIVEERGAVVALEGGRLTVECRTVAGGTSPGDSVSVNGVCLTAVEVSPARLSFDLAPETLDRSSLGSLRAGDPVNLERPVTLASRLGGHLMQGHVDGVGTVEAVRPSGPGATMRIRLAPGLDRYVVEKGSIAVDGVSLTVAGADDGTISVALIPHTLAATTLGARGPGDAVNLEVDVIAKYVERLMEGVR
ncbi:MAG TPA: riboflavin synthase [Actinomycetota bacterium]|nr:riboflavin synthase [Actinomycetota bacterium]